MASDYFEIVNPESLQFIAEVDEADIAMVKPGQEATITLDAYPDQEYNTYVDYVAYTSSQSTSVLFFVSNYHLIIWEELSYLDWA